MVIFETRSPARHACDRLHDASEVRETVAHEETPETNEKQKQLETDETYFQVIVGTKV